MTKYLKYLISLFMAFGLMVNDGILHSKSNSAEYYQVSYFKTGNEFDPKDSKSYVFHQKHSPEKIAFSIISAYLEFHDIHNLKTRNLQKLQNLLYQNISAAKAQMTFLSKVINSSNHFSN
ncbi:hypothetical protein [Flavobacterium marginilacus]|uniref:hypothetical protein n=1 Tax=Flavobacterium marginilacus TaxID=3003256 RepID=UPI00248E74BD|nr:hypothetical protein [Flavobacterium marginilacus]